MKRSGFLGGLLITILFFCSNNLSAQGDVINGVKTALKAGNSKELIKYLNKSSDLDIEGDRSTYSRTQAEDVLKDFFKNYQPTDFQIIHQGSSKAGSPYVIGQYTYKEGVFRVWIRLKEENEQYLVHAMSFYKD